MKLTEATVQFGTGDVKVEQRKDVHRGFFKVQKLRLKHRLFEGGWSQAIERELFIRDPAVGVLLYDPLRDQVALVEQFRIGALEDERSPWLLELVAGIIEPDETEADVARRETHEEAGCHIDQLIPLYRYWCSPGGSSERVTLYCACVDVAQLGGIHGRDDEHEDIRVRVLDADEVFTAMQDGRIDNAMSIIALQWLQLNRSSLQAKYS